MAENQKEHTEVTEQKAADQASSPAEVKPQPEGHHPPRLRKFGAAVAALLLYALLADAAVETFLSGSPLRWIISGTVATYLVITVLLWKRLHWIAKAALSLLVLLGLFSVTAWLPEGLTRGVTLTNLPTPIASAAISALAILTSTIVLVRLKFVPLTAKILIGLLGFYGVAAFLLGIVRATPYQDLFHGNSFWERLPFWLQGAFAGTLVLVPVTILVRLVGGLMRVRGRQLQGLAVQVLALGSSVAIAAAGLTGPLGIRGSSNVPQAAAPAPVGPAQPHAAALPTPEPQVATPSTSAPQLTVTVDELVKILKAYQRLAKTADRSSFDVKAKAQKLGGDVSAAFIFVRDQIANETYPGALRGPSGTLSARAGNDLDKASLLAALLVEHKRQIRYALCSLDESRAAERSRAMFDRSAPSETSDRRQALEGALVEEGLPANRSTQLVNTTKVIRDALDDAVARTAQADLAIVRESLDQAGIKPQPEKAQPTLLEEARPHLWVQVEDGGRWRDLDPAFSTAHVGQTFCTVSQTHTAIPPELHQSITFKVRNEYVEGRTLQSKYVLDASFPVPELHGQAIFFTNLPVPSGGLFSGGITGARRYEPALIIGQLVVQGQEFETARGDVGGPGSLFGQALSDQEGPRLVAQWLEFEIVAPGRKSVVSRAIVDTVDPVERANGSISTSWDLDLVHFMLVQPYAIGISSGRIDGLQAIEVVYGELDANVFGRLAAEESLENASDDLLGDFAAMKPRLFVAQALQLAADLDRMLGGSWKAAYPNLRSFRDRPMIVMTSPTLRVAADGRQIYSGFSFDVRHNIVRVIPQFPESGAIAFWANVHHGLIDGALERYLLHEWVVIRRPGSAQSTGDYQHLSTSALFELARSEGIAPRAVVGDEAGKVLRGQFARTAGHRLAGELTATTAVVLPSGPVRFHNEERLGIWALDLRTGHIIASLDTGLRQSAEERAALEDMQAKRFAYERCITKYAVRRALGATNTRLGGCKLEFLDFYNATARLWEVVAKRMVLNTFPRLPTPLPPPFP